MVDAKVGMNPEIDGAIITYLICAMFNFIVGKEAMWLESVFFVAMVLVDFRCQQTSILLTQLI